MTLRGVYLAVKGYYKKRAEIERSEWERTRWQTWRIYRMLGGKNISQQEFLPMTGDSIPEHNKRLNYEDELRLFEMWPELAKYFEETNQTDKLKELYDAGKI